MSWRKGMWEHGGGSRQALQGDRRGSYCSLLVWHMDPQAQLTELQLPASPSLPPH